ncbi:MAG: type IV pilus secretin PilQ [Nitrospinaceae bacterium]|jgi:type IV pilus assembly protein PilQ|nr:type IV pilus secretin PilQ [Nitrospinaceae bacterium]
MKPRNFLVLLLLMVVLWAAACATMPQGQLFETPPGSISLSDHELFTKALAHQKAGETDRAVDLWEKFLENQPRSFEARNNLGLLYYADDRIARAISQFERALVLKPGSAKIKRVLLGALQVRVAILEESREYDDTIVGLKRIFILSPEQARGKIALQIERVEGLIFEQVKKSDTLEGYLAFLEKYPDSPGKSSEARRRVEELRQGATAPPSSVPELVAPLPEEPDEIVTEPSVPILPAPSESAEPEPGGEPQPDSGRPNLAGLRTRNGENGDTVITLGASGSMRYITSKLSDPLRLVLDFPDMKQGRLPDSFTVNQGVVDEVRTRYFQEVNLLRMEIILNQDADYRIRVGADNQLEIHLNPAAAQRAQVEESNVPESLEEIEPEPAPEKVAAEQVPVTAVDPCEALLDGATDKIDLDFQDASLPSVLRIFSEISGFNIIIADKVNGNVNLRLRGVPWNQAFEIVLASNRLGARCIGDNIVSVLPLAEIANEEAAEKQEVLAAVAQEAAARAAAEEQEAREEIAATNSEDLVSETRHIDYGVIADISQNLDTLKSERGNIIVDSRTNTFILTDLRSNVDEMQELIDILDEKSPQVLIESRIVQISKNYAKDLGIVWGLTGAIAPKHTTRGNFNDQRGEINITNSGGNVGVGNPLINMGTTATATSGIGVIAGNVIAGLDLDIRLSAMESDGRGRILSAPKVMTVDHKEAQISSGRTIPYETTSQLGTATQFVNAEISLKVTPHVTSDGNVLLDIHATKNAADFANQDGNGNPTITTNEALSQVIVPNGGTTVLGGIFEQSKNEAQKKVPFFADIPILGWLFQNTDTDDEISELLIFITPTIVMGNEGTLREG